MFVTAHQPLVTVMEKVDKITVETAKVVYQTRNQWLRVFRSRLNQLPFGNYIIHTGVISELLMITKNDKMIGARNLSEFVDTIRFMIQAGTYV